MAASSVKLCVKTLPDMGMLCVRWNVIGAPCVGVCSQNVKTLDPRTALFFHLQQVIVYCLYREILTNPNVYIFIIQHFLILYSSPKFFQFEHDLGNYLAKPQLPLERSGESGWSRTTEPLQGSRGHSEARPC